MQVPSLGQKDTLQEEVATHSSILAWRTPWTKEPGRLNCDKYTIVKQDVPNRGYEGSGERAYGNSL